MRIEVAKEGRMDMTGAGLLRAIQNNSMPLLDLFARESIQNSLDAAEKSTKKVRVDFGIGHFNSNQLSEVLQGITSSLRYQYGNTDQSFLFIKDRFTMGLTGPVHFSDKSSKGKKNLLNLVYEVARPQDNEGAGGSWGYGKTIYFRMGIGLVLYYSRIKKQEGYESRLAACLVEDESKEDALLCDPELHSSRGLAWWGRQYEYESGGVSEIGTVPITDDREIGEILKIFNFQPFSGDETGTAILIPYIDEGKLLKSNISNDTGKVPWLTSVDEYLQIASLRWYCARINNQTYSDVLKQPWLQIAINNNVITNEDIPEPFRIIRRLYNMALTGEIHNGDNDYYCYPINLNKYFQSTTSGYVAYHMCSEVEMGMLPPINNPSPFIFVKNENGEDDYKDGDIILTYFRKPGMAVTYDTSGEWVNKIKCDNENTGNILLVVYVLNSKNRFNNTVKKFDTIEDYFRASEHADHTSWYDINVGDEYPRLLSKIQMGIRKKVNDTFKKDTETEESQSSSLSKMFGEFFLPVQGFGKRPSIPGGKSNGGGNVEIRHKNLSINFRRKDRIINNDEMIMPVIIKAEKSFENSSVVLNVAADGSDVPIAKWRDKVGMDIPFSIKKIVFHSIQSEKRLLEKEFELITFEKKELFTAKILTNNYGDRYGFEFSSGYNEMLITADIYINLFDVTEEMKFSVKEGE